MLLTFFGCLPISNEVLRPPLDERDVDGDGVSVVQGDCNDHNPNISPNLPENPYNGLDDDCSADTYDDDVDKDGFLVADDCDDMWSGTWPGAGEECTNGRDDNCNGISDADEAACQGLAPGPPTMVWHTFLGTLANDILTSIAPAEDGSLWVAGHADTTFNTVSTVQDFTAVQDVFVAKMDQDGNPLWVSFLGGAGFEFEPRIVPAQAGGLWVMASGNTASWGEPRWPYVMDDAPFLAKVDKDGHLLWHGFFDQASASHQMGYGIVSDTEGWVYVSMLWEGDFNGFNGVSARRSGENFYSMVVIALDADGTVQWATSLGTGSNTILMEQMLSSSSNNLAIGNDRLYVGLTTDDLQDWDQAPEPVRARTIADSDSLGVESAVAALDLKSGDLLSYTWLGGTGDDVIRSLAWGDGVLYAAGDSTHSWGRPDLPFSGNKASWVGRLDENLNLINHSFYGSMAGTAQAFALAWSGEALWAGVTTNRSWDVRLYGPPGRAFSGGVDWTMLRLSADLGLDWYAHYGSDGPEGNFMSIYAADDNVWITGSSYQTWGSPLRPHMGEYDGEVVRLKDPF